MRNLRSLLAPFAFLTSIGPCTLALAAAPEVPAAPDLWVTLTDSGTPTARRASGAPAWTTSLPARCGDREIPSFHRLVVDGGALEARGQGLAVGLDPATGGVRCETQRASSEVTTKDSFVRVQLAGGWIESDGYAISGSAFERVPAAQICGGKVVGGARIRRLEVVDGRARLTLGKHCSAVVDAATGKAQCNGCD